MTTQIANALAISRLIKEINPNCQVIWGGSHPTFFIDQTIAHPLVDIVCSGEGEITFFELASGQELPRIKGIIYKKNGQIIKNPLRELHDPAQTKLFNWDLVAPEILRKLELIPSLTSRGCPNLCNSFF